MAGEKLTQRSIATTADDNDLIHVVDVSDTTDSPEGTSKQITKGNFASSITPSASEILTAIKTVDGAGSGLDADRLDGQHGSYFYPASNPNGYTNDQTPAEILTAIKTVDGSGSGLDADTLDGKQGSDYIDISATEQTKTGNIAANTFIGNGGGNNFRNNGVSTGIANVCYNSYNDINGLRQGYIGFASANNSHMYLRNDVSEKNLILLENGVLSYNGNVTIGGNITSTAFFESSDKRLKNNIEPISDTFCSFELNNIEGKRYGVIAQDIELTNPELINTNDEGLKSVNYIDLLCLKVAELENKIKELENK